MLLGSGTLTRTGSPAIFWGVSLWSGTTHIYNDGRLIDLHPQGNYRLDGFDGASSNLEFANSGTVFFGDPSSPYPGSVGGSSSGPGSFTKSGAGDLFFTRNMTYGGQTTINGGNLVALVSNALPTSTDLTVNAGGSFTGGDRLQQTIGSLAGGGLVTLSGNTLTINGSTNAIFPVVISASVGSSAVQVKLKFVELLAGYTPGAIVRVKAESWKFVSMPPEERFTSAGDWERAGRMVLPW